MTISRIRGAIPTAQTTPVRSFSVDQAAVDALSTHMQDEVLGTGIFKVMGQGDIPAIDLVPALGSTTLSVIQNHWQNRDGFEDYEGPAAYKVSAMPKDKMLDLTLLCPVSGHCGAADAKAWAGLDPTRLSERNTFNVRITLADGSSQTLSGLEANGYVTPVALSLPLAPGKITIEYWPDRSGGVGGYPEGRTLEIFVPANV